MKQQTSATTETNIKGRNIIDFTGKTIHVGIDVHEKDFQVAKVLGDICLGNHRMAANGQEHIDHFRRQYSWSNKKIFINRMSIKIPEWDDTITALATPQGIGA